MFDNEHRGTEAKIRAKAAESRSTGSAVGAEAAGDGDDGGAAANGEAERAGGARSSCGPCGWVARRLSERKAQQATAAEGAEQERALVVGKNTSPYDI